MTKNAGREKRKYDYLNKKGALRTRQDYIDTSYVNGVRDAEGNELIRPLTKEEREWLSQFIAESDHGNFSKNKQLKEEEKKLKKLRMDHRSSKRLGDIDDMERLEKECQSQYELVLQLREETNAFYVTDEERHEVFDRDYERRMDLYNNAKLQDSLVQFDLHEYDRFSSEALSDPENQIIDQFYYPSKVKTKRRRKK